ncbi:MAG: hypothetical protein U9N73_08070 [Candidatus Auribacterota bacterium]|nr:hypothetical protein [Candidatus Auribacterota bacterium]
MFSDRYRKTKIAGLLIVLVLLAWYSDTAHNYLTLSECLKDPALYDGREVPIFLEARVLGVTPDCLRVSQETGTVDIIIPPRFQGMVPSSFTLEDIKPGQSLEAITIFRESGYLELVRLRIAPLRPLKIIVSIFPAIIILILVIMSLRWKKGRLVSKEVL